MGTIGFVSHSRTKMVKGDGKFSEVMTNIFEGIKEAFSLEANQKTNNLIPYLPQLSYSDPEEFLGLVEQAIKDNLDVLIIPYTLSSSKFLKLLKSFNGKIVGINVPPSDKTILEMKEKHIGYVGMNEFAAGSQSVCQFFRLTQKKFFAIKNILVIRHKRNHNGHDLRVNGIREKANDWGKKVSEFFIEEGSDDLSGINNLIQEKGLKGTGIITLGNRGTEFALENIIADFSFIPIIAMDSNIQITKAISDKKIICTLVQDSFNQGLLAGCKAISQERVDIFCGPIVMDSDNIKVINHLA